jgi:hypothetical protein
MSNFHIKPTNEIENITTLITKQQERIEFLENQIIKKHDEIMLYEKAVPKKTRIIIQEKLEQRIGTI